MARIHLHVLTGTPPVGNRAGSESWRRSTRPQGQVSAPRGTMRRIHGYRDLDPDQRGAAAAIGNFDGVHRGHQVLLRDARTAAEALGAPIGAITFEPHPRRFFMPKTPSFLLTTCSDTARIL